MWPFLNPSLTFSYMICLTLIFLSLHEWGSDHAGWRYNSISSFILQWRLKPHLRRDNSFTRVEGRHRGCSVLLWTPEITTFSPRVWIYNTENNLKSIQIINPYLTVFTSQHVQNLKWYLPTVTWENPCFIFHKCRLWTLTHTVLFKSFDTPTVS